MRSAWPTSSGSPCGTWGSSHQCRESPGPFPAFLCVRCLSHLPTSSHPRKDRQVGMVLLQVFQTPVFTSSLLWTQLMRISWSYGLASHNCTASVREPLVPRNDLPFSETAVYASSRCSSQSSKWPSNASESQVEAWTRDTEDIKVKQNFS